MTKRINPTKDYSLMEVAELGIAPYISSHSTLYRLVTSKVADGQRVLETKTTKSSIKAHHKGKPWGKISGKLLIKGEELIKFKKLNNL